MFKDILKKLDKEGDSNQKRKIENIVAFVIILIITVLVINNIWSKDENSNKDTKNKVLAQSTLQDETTENNQEDLEKNLEKILSSISGVGKTKVLIKYSESNKVVAMYNETSVQNKVEENDGSGGSKSSIETENKKEIAYTEDENGANKPITEKIIMPVIEGAIITAQGASNANIKASIVSAVEAVTGLAVHKIQVFEMEK